jgi:histidinol dehydrogenase
MQSFFYPKRSEWKDLVKRPVADFAAIEATVNAIIEDVRLTGDDAVRKYISQFDKAQLKNLQVSDQEIKDAQNEIPSELFDAIKLAADNIRRFHASQLVKEERTETMPGITCWRKSVAIDRVGLYIPGGTAPLFSTVLMLVIPAVIAGCRDIILCTPPSPAGKIHPVILACANYFGVKNIFKAGGAPAIAAMAYGTSSIPKVSKIFGPGNQYVTAAKQIVQTSGVAIDMPAGPSEVAVFADKTAVPSFVAADLLSQAEHGADSQVLLVTDHEPLLYEVQSEIASQLNTLPRKELAGLSLANSKIVLVKDSDEAIDLVNAYAPEHLILACENARHLSEKVINAGSVFIGHYSPESAGDYASGTNHTLPTNGYASAYSGVSVDSFVKKITFQELTKEGLMKIGKAVEIMAEAEGLSAHAEAVRRRIARIKGEVRSEK